MLVNLLRGTPKFDSIVGLSTCEWRSWLILLAFIVISSAFTWCNVRQIWRNIELKTRFDRLDPSEEYLTPGVLPKLLFASLMSGFIGQLFGLGGGFIYGPIIIAVGVNPVVSASTCLYMIMFSNSASFFMFLLYGRLNIPYTLFLGVFTGLGTLLGVCVTRVIMSRFKRASLIAFALGIACIISTSTSAVSSALQLKKLIANGVNVI